MIMFKKYKRNLLNFLVGIPQLDDLMCLLKKLRAICSKLYNFSDIDIIILINYYLSYSFICIINSILYIYFYISILLFVLYIVYYLFII